MHPLCRRNQRFGKAVGQLGNHAVQVCAAFDAVRHAGHIDADLGGGEAVDCLTLGDVPQIGQLFITGRQRISCGPGVLGGKGCIVGDVVHREAGSVILAGSQVEVEQPAHGILDAFPRSLPAAQASPYSMRWI